MEQKDTQNTPPLILSIQIVGEKKLGVKIRDNPVHDQNTGKGACYFISRCYTTM